MTVNTTNITSGPYIGNGLSDTYSYLFRVEDKTQLSVYETTDAGAQTLLVVDTDYTVLGIGVDGGGTIVRLAGNLPVDYTWYIRSNYVENQLTAFASQGGFFPDVHEAQMDHITFLIQQLRDEVTRTFRLSDSIDIDGNFNLLNDAADRSGQYLSFDPSGNIVISSGTGADAGLREDLASLLLGKGATLLALRDAPGNFLSSDLESAMEEINVSSKSITTTGTASVYVAAIGVSTYETDRVYKVQIHIDNAGACTMDLGPGAKNVKLLDGVDPHEFALMDGMIGYFLYDGTNLVVLNPVSRKVRHWGYSIANFSAASSGVAVDSATGNLIRCDGGTNLIYIHDDISVTVSSSFATPGVTARDITIDQSTGNLISCDGGTNLIYIHDGISVTVSSSFAIPATSISGVAVDPSTGNLISCDIVANLIYIHDGISVTVSSSFAAPSTGINAIAVDPTTGNLISCDNSTNLIYIHDGISSTILGSFATPSSSVNGVAIDSATGNLISGDLGTNLIYIHLTQSVPGYN